MPTYNRITDPRSHFAAFWKQRPSEPKEHRTQLRQDLQQAIAHVVIGDGLSSLLTVEVDDLEERAPDQPQASSRVHWLVSADVVEVALLACALQDLEESL